MIKNIYKRIVSEKTRLNARLSFNKITSVLYRGNNYRCNVCKRNFRKLKTKGSLISRHNAECPYCGSLERTRVLLFYLQNETDIFERNKVSLLHIAPEWCLIPIFKESNNIHYVSGDLNPNYADEQMDITDIPYPDESFDYIICSHVLGHVPDEAKAVKELRRVLKKNGTALILSIIDWGRKDTIESSAIQTDAERLANYSEPDLLRLHGADFAQRLRKGGFRVEEIDYRIVLGDEKQERYSLGNGDREMIFRCTIDSKQ